MQQRFPTNIRRKRHLKLYQGITITRSRGLLCSSPLCHKPGKKKAILKISFIAHQPILLLYLYVLKGPKQQNIIKQTQNTLPSSFKNMLKTWAALQLKRDASRSNSRTINCCKLSCLAAITSAPYHHKHISRLGDGETLYYSERRMEKQSTLNYLPEIIKELGNAHSFPSPSCGSLLLMKCFRGYGVHCHATTQPQEEESRFQEFSSGILLLS